jgi:hypothetical protein
MKLAGFSVVVIILQDELHAVAIPVAVANKASENQRPVGMRKREFDSNLRANR